MTKTEKRYWQNGHRKMGGWFNTLALSFFNVAVLFIWGTRPTDNKRIHEVKFYQLTK